MACTFVRRALEPVVAGGAAVAQRRDGLVGGRDRLVGRVEVLIASNVFDLAGRPGPRASTPCQSSSPEG